MWDFLNRKIPWTHNEKIWTVNYCSVVATSHDKWTHENLVKEIFFAFNITEGRKALAKHSYWSELGRPRWSGEMATTGFYGVNH